MTDTIAARTTERPSFGVRRVRDRRQIDALLSDDRAYAAYALGHLDDGLFERSEFWIAESAAGAGLVLHADAMGATMITAGDAPAVDAILSLHPGPRSSYLSTATPEHMALIERRFAVSDPLRMTRMFVTRLGFQADEHAPGGARRLRGSDVGAINSLYALDDRPSHYSPLQIERSVYYGAFDASTLVAIAGTHLVSPLAGVGIVGNVLTHPAYRGRGLAKRVTSRVTADLLDRGCSLVVLTADPANTPAVRAYERLGYEPGAPVVEAHLRRKDALGVGAWLRRRRAHRGGDGEEAAPGHR